MAIGRKIHANNMKIPSNPASADRVRGIIYKSKSNSKSSQNPHGKKVSRRKGKGKRRTRGKRELGKGRRVFVFTVNPLDIQCVRTKRNDFPVGGMLATLTPPTSDNCPNYRSEGFP